MNVLTSYTNETIISLARETAKLLRQDKQAMPFFAPQLILDELADRLEREEKPDRGWASGREI